MSGFHFARPMPFYWDFQCSVCRDYVKGHLPREIAKAYVEYHATKCRKEVHSKRVAKRLQNAIALIKGEQ